MYHHHHLNVTLDSIDCGCSLVVAREYKRPVHYGVRVLLINSGLRSFVSS